MLILFDIDGTLLLTKGAGIAAMVDAGRELFGPHFHCDGVEFSGRLDTLIWNDLARINGIDNADDEHERFRSAYGNQLRLRLDAQPTAKLLPGVADLVARLEESDDFTLGVLTGNYPETGRLKIERAGLNPDVFEVAAWGCEGSSRRDLPLVAMRRHVELSGAALDWRHVVIIGDTPHDVDCARAHGCRSIGVATGLFDVESLTEAGADLAVPTLADTQAIVNWLSQPVAMESR